MPISRSELLTLIDGVTTSQLADKDVFIANVAPLAKATENDASFIEGARLGRLQKEQLSEAKAGLIFVPLSWQEELPIEGQYAFHKDPSVAFIKAQKYIPELNRPIDYPAAQIANSTFVHPSAVIEDGVVIGEECSIGANVSIGKGVTMGAKNTIDPNVVIYSGVNIGNDCRIMANATIGSDGFGWRPDNGRWLYFPQIGGVEIGNDVHIGANTAIDCGTLEPTKVNNGVRLDNQIHIAHNCEIGEYTAIAGCTGIAGSTKIGKWCLIGGSADILGHITIGDFCVIQGTTFVAKDMEQGTKLSSAIPGKEPKQWARTVAYINKLGELHKRVKMLEREAAIGQTDSDNKLEN